MSRVAIIGAGPAGLVAARVMLEKGLAPVIFEKSQAVGGMWHSNRCWSSLQTNISKYTCCFSDFPWKASSPVFPAWREVTTYLQEYSTKFLSKAQFIFGTEVTKVSQSDIARKWKLLFLKEDKIETDEFDYVVVASGYFSKQYIPPNISVKGQNVTHSHTYHGPKDFTNKNVVVVGGSFSGVDIAADIAPHAKSVLHIYTHPFWVLPRFVPSNTNLPNTAFLPLDLEMYKRRTRATSHEQASRPSKVNQIVHKYLGGLVGGRQGNYSPPDECDTPPTVTISDTYVALEKEGKIKCISGRLKEVTENNEIVVDIASKLTKYDQIDSVVFCTGYQINLSFLSQDCLDVLNYTESPKDVLFQPICLHKATLHPKLPGLAFVGMYRGPYFGVMELQARWAVAQFLKSVVSNEKMEAGVEEEIKLRDIIPRPQFPHWDYVGLANDLAEFGEVKIQEPNMDIVVPAMFSDSREELHAVEQDYQEFNSGKGIAFAVFYGLQGSWKLDRQVTSSMVDTPSMDFSGTATFTLKDNNENEITYEYNEHGQAENGMAFKMNYRYVYSKILDEITIFKSDGDFYQSIQKFSSHNGAWHANSSQHICGPDLYNTKYTFTFEAAKLKKMIFECHAKGPHKDYVHYTTFTPVK